MGLETVTEEVVVEIKNDFLDFLSIRPSSLSSYISTERYSKLTKKYGGGKTPLYLGLAIDELLIDEEKIVFLPESEVYFLNH